MLRERLQTSTSLLFSGAITLSLPTLLAETITLSLKFRLRPSDRLPARPPVTDEFEFRAVRVDNQRLCLMFGRRELMGRFTQG